MKPFKGYISNWNKVPYEKTYFVRGRPSGHPDFKDFIRTSLVVKTWPADNGLDICIETLNSRYILMGKETETPMPLKY
jgi:hypothetical protein